MIMGKIWRGLEEEELVGLMGFGWGGGRWEVGGVEMRREKEKEKEKVGRVRDCMRLERRDRGGGYVRQG